MTSIKTPPNEHAVVLGAGIAGLLAARVLTNHYARVTILGPHSPQPPFPITFTDDILELIERIHPGFRIELGLAGVWQRDPGHQMRVLFASGWSPRAETGLMLRTCTRPFVEQTLRTGLSDCPNVVFETGREPIRLIPDAKQQGVAGVVTQRPGMPDSMEELCADLVVDTSGESTSAWLRELGYGPLHEDTVRAPWSFVSRLYRGQTREDIEMHTRPPLSLAGMLHQVEDKRMVAVFAGPDNDPPRHDEDGFLAYALRMPSADLYEALHAAEAVSPIFAFRSPGSRWRRFEQMPRWPVGLVAIGDSVCTLHPLLDRGAALWIEQAVALQNSLREQRRCIFSRHSAGVARGFQGRAADIVSRYWWKAEQMDLRTAGSRTQVLAWYLGRLTRIAPQDSDIFRFLLETDAIARPASALFTPPLVRKLIQTRNMEVAVRVPSPVNR